MNEIAIVENPEFITSIDEAKSRLSMLKAFVKTVMSQGSDYGIVPGTDKPTLLKPGAEKLANIYGLYSEIEIIDKIQDWDKPFFAYTAKATLYSKRTGIKESEGIGSCNSKEAKYAYRWVFESDLPQGTDKEALKSKEFYSKKQNRKYKMYRVDNDDIYSLVNTIAKMASKRAYIDAVLKATRTSEFFTQDIEDISDYRPVAKKDSKDKKAVLDSIANFRDTLGMDKEKLHDLVNSHFGTTDVAHLSLEQLKQIDNELTSMLSDEIDGVKKS